jgi:hypothetical protein
LAEKDNTFVRVEIGFDGGQILSWLVKPESATELERSLSENDSPTVTLEAEDGTILLLLSRIVYAKRFAREGRVGFEV